ncbi:MAG: nuclear transport factor 2 family protein [Flavobacteriales bacterium]
MSTATAVKTTQEVANRHVSLCREGKFLDAVRELYAPNVVSDEPQGGPRPSHYEGFESVLKKNEEFTSGIEEVHSNIISDPLVADNHFTVSMKMDVTMKGMGRIQMDEICVYRVENGKIVNDHFFYRPMPMPGQN